MSDNLNSRMDTDLSGMNPEQAGKYVAGFITNLKELQNWLVQFTKDKTMWSDRLALAQKNNRQDLIDIAAGEIKKIEEKEIKYKNEYDDLKIKVDILKDEYAKLISTYDNEVAMDKANVLLEELKSMTNDDNPGLKKEFKNMDIDDELNKMKNDLNK